MHTKIRLTVVLALFITGAAVGAAPTIAPATAKTASPGVVDRGVPSPKMQAPIGGVGQVVLKWSTVPGAATYNVYAGDQVSDVKKSNPPLQKGLKATETIVPIGLPSKESGPQRMYFAVSAVASGEESDLSPAQLGSPAPTAAPSNVVAKPGDKQVEISWTSVGAASYEIDYGTQPNKFQSAPGFGAVVGNSATISATVTGLANGTAYNFIVKARSLGSDVMPASPAVLVVPSVTAPTPAKPVQVPTVPLIDVTKSPCMGLLFTQEVLKEESSQDVGQPEGYKPSPQTQNSRTIRAVQRLLSYEKQAGVSGSEKTSAIACNVWLTNETRQFQQRASSASVQPFPKFNASIANNSQLVTTHFVSAFMPTWLDGPADFRELPAGFGNASTPKLDPYTNSHWYNDLGFDISSSVPISSAKLSDYAQQELLTRDGGLLNLYVSASGRNYSNEAYAWGNRSANLDRLYFIDLANATEPATGKQALMFLSEGLGIKALKTSLSGTGSLGAQGTGYLGVGVDGPLFLAESDPTNTGSTTAADTPQGMASLEGYISGNVVTGSAISALFGVPNPAHAFVSWGATLKLYVTSSVGIQVQYVSALNSGVGRIVGHVAMLTIGYTQSTNAASTAQKAPVTGTPASSNPAATGETQAQTGP